MTNSPANAVAVELVKPKDFLVQFLKDTKEWNKISITKEYYFKATRAEEVAKLINNMRVMISRIRGNYKANGKTVPPFRFTSVIEKLAESDSIYKVTLGKSNSATSQNKILIEELL